MEKEKWLKRFLIAEFVLLFAISLTGNKISQIYENDRKIRGFGKYSNSDIYQLSQDRETFKGDNECGPRAIYDLIRYYKPQVIIRLDTNSIVKTILSHTTPQVYGTRPAEITRTLQQFFSKTERIQSSTPEEYIESVKANTPCIIKVARGVVFNQHYVFITSSSTNMYGETTFYTSEKRKITHKQLLDYCDRGIFAERTLWHVDPNSRIDIGVLALH